MTNEGTMDLSTVAVLCSLFCYVFFNLFVCWCFTRPRSHRRDSSSDTFEELEMIQMISRSNDQQTFHDEPSTIITSGANN